MLRCQRIQQYSKHFSRFKNLNLSVWSTYQQVKYYALSNKSTKANIYNKSFRNSENDESNLINKRDQLLHTVSNSRVSYYTTYTEDAFIPSVYLSNILIDFKLKYAKLMDIHQKVAFLKSIIEQLRLECDSTKKSDQLIAKIKPLVINVLLELGNKEFVEFHQYICLKSIRLNNDEIDSKMKDILKNGILIDKFNLLTCGSHIDPVSISKIRTPLTAEKTELISKTYSTTILKFIITEIYGRFNDKLKINEYLTILKLRSNDDESIRRFENFIDIYFYEHPIDIRIQSSSNPLYVLNKLALYLTQHVEVPKLYSDSFNEILLAKFPTSFNHKLLFSYFKTCYGEFGMDLQTLNYNKDLITLKHSLSKNFSSVINKNKSVPNSIMLIFFYKYLSFPVSEKNIRSLIDQFEAQSSNSETVKQFKFTLFHIATTIMDEKPEFFKFLLNYIHNENVKFSLPKFEYIDIKNLYSYYENDFQSFLNSITTLKTYELKNFQVSSKDIKQILEKLTEIERRVLVETLIDNSVTFDDLKLIYELISLNPTLVDNLFSYHNIKTTSNHNSAAILSKPILYFSPTEILKVVTSYSDMIPDANAILKTLKPYDQDFEYFCAKLSTLKFKKPDFNYILQDFTNFLKENKLCDSNLNLKITIDQQIQLYNLFIMKVIKYNHFLGAHFSCTLIPCFRKNFLKATGIQESHLTEIPKQLVLNENIQFNNQLVYEYTKKYCENNSVFKLHISLFKKVIDFSLLIENIKEREEFQILLFKSFQSYIKPEIFSPITIFRIWQIAESYGIESKWKLNFNISKYLEIHYSDSNRFETDKPFLFETFHLLGKYESSIEISKELIEKVFLSINDKNKLLFIINLRNSLLSVPYIPSVETFIKESFDSDPITTLKIFGIEYEDPLISNAKSKRAKWMKFDPRYYSCLIDNFMTHIISKNQNISIRQMIIDSFSFMKQDDNELNKVLKFYNLYLNVSTFDSNPKLISSNDFDKLFNEFQINFRPNIMDHEHFMPIYLYQPFIYHFMFTRILTYDLNTVFKMLYVITEKNKNLEKLGFWKMIDDEDKRYLESKIPEISIYYKVDNESKYMNLFKVFFTLAKNSREIASTELSNIITIAENLIKNAEISKRNKYTIMNCIFILISRHSDLLSTFYKKMKIILPDYKVSKPILEELLYSSTKNDLGNIDLILTNLIESHDLMTLDQSVESVVKKLINDEEHNLAQELYLKYSERNHKFRINDLPGSFNWSKARQPAVTVDSNAGVNMKMNKFKVKLYDYDSLSK